MKRFLILLFLSYASSDKLDLTYLPPPGSQYAGGRPDDIQTPLEYPKETYSTTQPPSTVTIGQNVPSSDDYKATIGIDRVPPSRIQGSFPSLSSNAPINNYQNSYTAPSTTVSYAFTQTTTHPPTEGFETTISPIDPVTGFPTKVPFNVPLQEFSQIYRGNNKQFPPNAPGYQQYNTINGQTAPTDGFDTTISPIDPITGFPTKAPFHIPSQEFNQIYRGNNKQFPPNAPDYQQYNTINDQTTPTEGSDTTNSPIAPITGFPTKAPYNVPSQEFSQIYRGNNKQFPPNAPSHQQYNTITGQTTLEPIAQFPDFSLPSSNRFFGDQNLPGQTELQQGYQQSGSGRKPGSVTEGPLQQSQYPRNQSLVGGYNRQPGISSSTNTPQVSTSGFYPPGSSDRNINNLRGYTTAIPDDDQSGIYNKVPNVYQPGDKITSQNNYPNLGSKIQQQQYPGYSGSTAEAYQPTSTATPTISASASADYSSPANFRQTDQSRIDTNAYIKRPERPQAQADRNAVILNYKNVITPEGFEYSFDTSNGIHADENGTAIDGVKAEGSYSYTGDDGKVYTVVYTADENGFRPRGDHLPTPPPIPEAIQRLIEKANKDKEAGIFHDGSYDEEKYGHKKYQEVGSGFDKVSSGKQEDYYSPTRQQGSNQITASQPGSKKPTKQFDDLGDSQEQLEDDQVVEDDIRTNYKKTSLRPENRISNQYSRMPISGSKVSRRPVTNVERIHNQEEFYDKNNKNQINKQRPSGNQYPFEKDEQYIDKFATAEENEEENIPHKNILYKGESRVPLSQQNQRQMGADRIRKPGSSFNQNRNENNRQTLAGRPVSGISQDNTQAMFDELENGKRPAYRLPSRRPTEQSVTGEDGLESTEIYSPNDSTNEEDETKIINRPHRLPSKYPAETTKLTTVEDYSTSSEVPSRYKPSRINKPVLNMKTQEIISTRRRPSRPGLKVDNVNLDDQGSIDEITNEYATEEYDLDNTQYTTPAGKDRFEVTQDFNPQSNQQFVTKSPQTFTSSSDRLLRPRPSYQNERNGDQINENVKYGQKLNGKSTVSPSPNVENTRNNNNYVFNSTGYQYIPPRNRFNYDERNNYSTRYPGTGASSIRKPSQQLSQYVSKDSNAKPFITPNVSRVNSKSPQDYDENIRGDNEKLPDQQRYDESPMVENYDQYSTPDQIFSDEVISTGRPSIQSILRPTMQTTRRPQYNHQYLTTAGYKTTPEEIVPLFQKKYEEKDSDTRTPYDIISSTTPVPSGRPTYYSPKEVLISGQKNTYYSEDANNQRRPINIVSPTTASNSQTPAYSGSKGSVYDESYPNGNIENQYQSTYRPNQTTTPTYDRVTASRLPNTDSTKIIQTGPKATQNIYGNQPPSTTYRPNYRIKDNEGFTRKPILQLDDFGRPIVNSEGQDFEQQYTPGPDGSSPVDSQDTSYQYAPKVKGTNKPGSDQNPRIPGYQSTERIIGEDFSGPKQQQRFDPNLGYYY